MEFAYALMALGLAFVFFVMMVLAVVFMQNAIPYVIDLMGAAQTSKEDSHPLNSRSRHGPQAGSPAA